jgi:hypothetical protein
MTIPKFLHWSKIFSKKTRDSERRATRRYGALLAMILWCASGTFAQATAPTDFSKASPG